MIALPEPHKITPCPCFQGVAALKRSERQICTDFFVDGVYRGVQGAGVKEDQAKRLAQLDRMEVCLRNFVAEIEIDNVQGVYDVAQQAQEILTQLPEFVPFDKR